MVWSIIVCHFVCVCSIAFLPGNPNPESHVSSETIGEPRGVVGPYRLVRLGNFGTAPSILNPSHFDDLQNYRYGVHENWQALLNHR
jgi:hypothetical protein